MYDTKRNKIYFKFASGYCITHSWILRFTLICITETSDFIPASKIVASYELRGEFRLDLEDTRERASLIALSGAHISIEKRKSNAPLEYFFFFFRLDWLTRRSKNLSARARNPIRRPKSDNSLDFTGWIYKNGPGMEIADARIGIKIVG